MDPSRMTVDYAILFPGQGSQHVGMGEEVFAARPDLLGSAADDVLGWSLRQACLEGPEERLTSTDVAQPALYALSYALFAEATNAGLPQPQMAAGHSLGEYTALAAAGYLDFFDGLALVAERGSAMAEAAASRPSSMAALLGASDELAAELAAQRRADGGELYVANLNAPGQVVLAGSQSDIEWLVDNARDLGVRRAVALSVAGAFHSPFMAGATEQLAAALGAVGFSQGGLPVYSNVTAEPHQLDDLPALLADQVTAPVLFAQSLVAMSAAGVGAFVHCGPGDVTAGMAKRTVKEATTQVVNSLDDVGSVVAHLIQ